MLLIVLLIAYLVVAFFAIPTVVGLLAGKFSTPQTIMYSLFFGLFWPLTLMIFIAALVNSIVEETEKSK